MRSVKKLLKKAMVFTLTAAMLVGTPLTASAAPLNSVYSIRDHWGEDKDNVDDASHTGTVTNTETTTETGALKDNEAKIIGIVLDKSHVNVEVGGARETLTATIVTDLGEDEALVNKFGEAATEEMMSVLMSKLKWQVLNPDGTIDGTTNQKLSIDTVTKGDGSKIVLNPRQGTKAGEDMIVKVSLDGTYYFTTEGVKTDLVANGTEGYSAEATVSIKEYSEGLKFEGVTTEQFVKHTYNLGACLVRTPETANDTITWTTSDSKTATVNADGIVTFKKATKGEDTVKITAVSEKGKTDDVDFTVSAGTPASKVEIWPEEDGEGVSAYKSGAKLNLDLGVDGQDYVNVRVKMYANVKSVKVDAEGNAVLKNNKPQYETKKNLPEEAEYYVWNGEAAEVAYVHITDNITWTTSKATIAGVDEANNYGAGIVAAGKALGTAKITAKASSGKSANVNAVVKATLNDLWIEGLPEDGNLYSGQSVQLTAGRDPELNKDAVKWSIKKVGNKANPNASINSKGVLTIKPKLNLETEAYSDQVTVVLETKATKKVDNKKVPVLIKEETITIAQSNISEITVKEADKTIATAVYNATKKKVDKNKGISSKDNTTNISVPKTKEYEITAVDTEGNDLAGTLTVKSDKTKIATVTYDANGTAKIKAVAVGKAKITVSGVAAGKAISTTFNVTVKQPTTSITINTPSVVVKQANKDAKLTLKATQNKGAKETITWSIQKNGVDADATVATVKGGKVTLKKGQYAASDVFTVTATSQSRVTATATIQVVTASTAVRVVDENGDLFQYEQKKGKTGHKTVKNATTLELGDSVTLYPEVNVGKSKPEAQQNWIAAGTKDGDNQAAAVTYSVSKKGIVQIVGNTVYRVGNGTVKVTVKTADGKKYTLTIDDDGKRYVAPSTED